MRMIFVRHGHPDYARDCLTPLGRHQAGAAAQRLQEEGISRIFSSTCGRALETASYTAATLALPVERCDFMREIRWGATDGTPLMFDGHPWDTADQMVLQGTSLLEADWAILPPFDRNRLVGCVQHIASATDEWLQRLGYTREGLYYRCSGNTQCTIAVFGHGGASAAILSHLFNLPFPFVCTTMGPTYTGLTVVTLPDAQGKLVSPRFELMNDARHIQNLQTDNYFGN